MLAVRGGGEVPVAGVGVLTGGPGTFNFAANTKRHCGPRMRRVSLPAASSHPNEPLVRLAIAAAFMFTVGLAAAETAASNDEPAPDPTAESGAEMDGIGERIDRISKKIDQIAEAMGGEVADGILKLRIKFSPMLLRIVCRVAHEPFTKGELSRAMGVPEEEIFKAVGELESMKLVIVRLGHGGGVVFSANDRVQDMMQIWAEEWCANDDTCGVKK